MLRYAIAQNVLGSTLQVPITQSDFEAAEVSYHRLQLVVAAEERFDATARNFLDLESDMLASTLETTFVGFGAGMEQMAIRRLLNRRMSNLLSAARAYIDHMRRAAKELFGGDSRSEDIINHFSHHYDNHLGYRALEALRNYSQHYGFPIHSVRYSVKVLSEKPGTPIMHTVSPILDVAILKSDGQFKASVLKELQSKSQLIDLRPLTRRYISCLAEVHGLFRTHISPVSSAASKQLESLAQTFANQSPACDFLPGVYAVAIDGPSWVKQVPLFAGLWEYGEFLAKTNVHFAQAGFCFVSGESDADA